LRVENIKIDFPGKNSTVRAVNGVSFAIKAGETLGIIGESGSGKSVTALALLGLLEKPGRVLEGRIIYKGRDVLLLSRKEKQRLRGREMAMVFQDPLTSLNPVLTVGRQLTDVLRRHLELNRHQTRERALRLLQSVGLGNHEGIMKSFPFQLSGGMRQRVMLALALGANPSLLIADEPTTALDVTVQAQIIRELHRLQQEKGMAMLVITHNWGVVAELADRVGVMYNGRLVEYGSIVDIFNHPAHPYTHLILSSVPVLGKGRKGIINIHSPVSRVTLNGCSFAPRCMLKGKHCLKAPLSAEISPGHFVACHLAGIDSAIAVERRRELA